MTHIVNAQSVNPDDIFEFDSQDEEDEKCASLRAASQKTRDKALEKRIKQLCDSLKDSANNWHPSEQPSHLRASSSIYLEQYDLFLKPHFMEMIEDKFDQWFQFEIAPGHMRISSETLVSTSAHQLINEMEWILRLAGIDGALGCAWGWLHGGYDAIEDEYPLYFRGIANRAVADAISALGTLPRFKSTLHGVWPSLSGEIGVRVKPLTDEDLPHLSFVQTRWPMRLRIYNGDGTVGVLDNYAPIPDRHEAQALLWLDQWTADDLTLKIGLEISEEGITRKR